MAFWLCVLRCGGCNSVYFPATLGTLSTLCLRDNWSSSTPPTLPCSLPSSSSLTNVHLQAQAPPSSHSLAACASPFRSAMPSASSASRPTEHVIACAHTLIIITVLLCGFSCTCSGAILLSLVGLATWSCNTQETVSET